MALNVWVEVVVTDAATGALVEKVHNEETVQLPLLGLLQEGSSEVLATAMDRLFDDVRERGLAQARSL